MARESRTKYAVLGLLQLAPKCGYEIKKELERSSMFFWNESYGQIYPMLKRLVDEELATLDVVERGEQAEMKVYTITQAGQEELARWLEQPAEPHPVRDELLLKLYFGHVGSPTLSLVHLERLRAHLLEQRQGFEAQRARYQQLIESQQSSQAMFGLMTLRYGELVNEAIERWCQETSEALDAERLKASSGSH